MKVILAIIVAIAAAWSIYWFVGSSAVERGISGWLQDRAEEGWMVNTSDVSTTGFPNRFDTTISDIELADPETGLAWEAPFFQILALSYNPHHIIAVWPDQQTIATPLERIDVTSANMRGSVVFDRASNLRLNRTTIEFESLGLMSSLDWKAALDQGQLAVRQTESDTNTYDIAFRASGLQLPNWLIEQLEKHGLTRSKANLMTVEATAAFNGPWDLSALEDARPQPTHIDLSLAQVKWDDLELRLAGTVDIADGIPEGQLSVQATNWREILEIAKTSGVIPNGVGDILERGLATLARMKGNPDTIDIPLEFKDGRTTLGGLIPLGPAPLIVLR
ncbi:DUF2125 domain-containing protein [Qingshengfaniella alkalisoli]|uniref:DUF2125 domain-containing protein n=1 Tax=Qingshengfaniella alkalisoli TaxID=2599296 RepID=A0A5B8IVB4_9RHOB|nr:DUF2125 domain-containing protein [Qingshengfaniella alkalisoli]QDY68428.1 DUF2125 domain-containing protein [Qingshengfaniella alkalisoli]